MSNFTEEALSVVVARFDVIVKERMFEINRLLSESSSSERFIDILGDKIVEFTIVENSLNNARGLLNQSLEARIQKIKDFQESIIKQKEKNYEIEFPD